MLNWANRFNIFCFLDNHQYHFGEPAFECLLGAGCTAQMSAPADGGAFTMLADFYKKHPGWLFGHLGYDLKNEVEQLQSSGKDNIGFADLGFFVPETVLEIKNNLLYIYTDEEAVVIFDEILATSLELPHPLIHADGFIIQQSASRQDYLRHVKELQAHILRGDCYEVNYCQEFFVTGYQMDPVAAYFKLAAVNPSPFAALYKLADKYCISASPERYLKIENSLVISQPMKGTAFRDLEDPIKDEVNKQQLLNSEKEKSENVMVVDLVRNDLSKVCTEGSVRVTELFGMYSFPQVHQLISTVEGTLKSDCTWIDAVKATFPMGSMTGAPKKNVMELIDKYEVSKRGLYSGAIGYVHPNGNIDFNVVIRSILYNATNKYISFQAGSAITFYSNAESEYEECLLKTAAVKQVLQQL